jgi:hypothetical protein
MAALTRNEPLPAEADDTSSQPQHRYFAVLVLSLAAVVFLIGAPAADWSLGLALAIQGAALVVTIATSRERRAVRRRRTLAVGLALIAAVILIALGFVPRWLSAGAAVLLTAAVPIALVRGLLRLLRDRGVSAQAVAGSLAIYLSIGLIFAWIIGFIAQVSSTPYFAQGTSGSQGDKVYYSFTVMTTTGFGDFSPATPAGHAVAVIEMLTGQLYLVTVIGLLIGNFAARRRNR